MAPGPSSRGCEACRAQKKKCDLAKPTCSRCHKLRIACVGCGQKRFKFEAFKWAPPPQDQQQPLFCLAPTPGNETSLLQQDLVARLQTADDVRYQIAFRYGYFLKEIPKRLGRNAALDASVMALLARHTETSLRQDQSNPNMPAVIHYNRALAALRAALDDPCEGINSDIMCAVMLLVYCQARFDDQFTFFWSPHAQGVAQLIRMRQFTPGKDTFETMLFGPLNATLLLQSFGNPYIQLSSEEYRKLEKAFIETALPTLDIQLCLLMCQASEVMAQGRRAIVSGSCLETIAVTTEKLAVSMQLVASDMRKRLKGVEAQACEKSINHRLHASCQRTLGVTLATCATLICAQRTLSPDHATLDIAASSLCQEVLQLSQDAKAYRPIGAVWTVHTLICTWCATQDASLKAKVEHALLDYQRDAMGPKAHIRLDQLRLLEQRLSLRASLVDFDQLRS